MKTRVNILAWSLTISMGLLTGCDERKPAVSAPVDPHTASAKVESIEKLDHVVVGTTTPSMLEPTTPDVSPEKVKPIASPILMPEASSKKLAVPLLKAWQMAQEQLAAGQPATEMPDIPIHRDGCVLVDLEATVSEELIDHIVSIGGQTLPHPEPKRPVRAFIPLEQLGDLAARADVSAISAAVIVASGGMQPLPSPPAAK